MMRTCKFPNGLGTEATDCFIMPDIVHIYFFSLDTRDASITVAQFFHGKSNNIGET